MASLKQPAAILLFTIYLFTQAVAPCWYIIQHLSHSFFAALQQLEPATEKLVIVSINKEALNKIKTGEDEIMLNGILYDIEKNLTKNNQQILYLKQDLKETKWQKHAVSFNNLLHKQTHSKGVNYARIRGMFIAFFYERISFKDEDIHSTHKKDYAAYFVNEHIPPYPGLSSPPPKNCSFINS